MTSDTTPPSGSAGQMRDFLKNEAAGGLVLMVAAALALICANSPLAKAYFDIQQFEFGGLSLLHWINDALMALFFLLVGLEIKREMLAGQLATWPQRALPGIAALGGMIVPALIYVAFAGGDAQLLRGWAIPTATDIAFALGVLALLGSRAPTSLKVFLTALAIIDDLGAVIIIALFYTEALSFTALALAALVLATLVQMNRQGVTWLWLYLLLGVLLWLCVWQSGIHATLAGVALALTIPLRTPANRAEPVAQPPLLRLEHALHPWVTFLIVPLFGFANAGVFFGGMSPAVLLGAVPLGVAAGLFLGKQIGVFGAAWLAIRSGRAALPAQAGWTQLYGVALLCGIGFTMSLFVGGLAFADAPELGDATKLGVLAGSLLSALAGAAVLLGCSRNRN